MTDAPEIIELPVGQPAAPALRSAPLARRVRAWLAEPFGGIVAVGVKELRGRMRGRRAFVILTIYLMLLGGFAWMVEMLVERSVASGFNQATGSAQIGQAIFIALLFFETLLVLFLAPAFTAGAISLEREKQTLDLLVTTPISSLAIVVGKLLSALVYVFLLIIASIPLTALVFLFGGVGPEDLVRGYAVLLVTALGLGSVGLFCSTLVRRTQAATIITYFTVLAMTIGAVFVFVFWQVMVSVNANPVRDANGNFVQARPPEALLYFNPFVADADVLCGTENGYGTWCGMIGYITNQQLFGAGQVRAVPVDAGGNAAVVDVAQEPEAFGVIKDTYWPKSAAAWLVLSAVLILLSVQLVTPTRRWRFGMPRFGTAPRSPD
jgi:ABC-type transport system involved in multi-copper enzyme maturation permease subunit